MNYASKLQKAPLLKRYKRFLVDIDIADQAEPITIHCANTGKMTGCADAGFTAYYSTSSNPKRKYPHSLELTQNHQGDLICVNTSLANHIVVEAIRSEKIKELGHYSDLKQEVKYGSENSRIDILLSDEKVSPCYIEVKSVTLLGENGQGYFPDTTTVRGLKHLRELIEVKQQGYRAVLFFLVQHMGIETVASAKHIDPAYAKGLTQAIDAGVEVLCYKTHITENNITLEKAVPFIN